MYCELPAVCPSAVSASFYSLTAHLTPSPALCTVSLYKSRVLHQNQLDLFKLSRHLTHNHILLYYSICHSGFCYINSQVFTGTRVTLSCNVHRHGLWTGGRQTVSPLHSFIIIYLLILCNITFTKFQKHLFSFSTLLLLFFYCRVLPAYCTNCACLICWLPKFVCHDL